MKLRMVLDHSVGFRYDEDDYGGTFEMEVEAPFDRTPTLDEGVLVGDGLILTVHAVTWRLDGSAELRLAVDTGASAATPTRRALIASGWVELDAIDDP